MVALRRDIISESKRTLLLSVDAELSPQIVDWYMQDKWPHTSSFSEAEVQEIQADIKQLCDGVPLAYVTNISYFLQYVLYVNPSVLIPRPETEELVEWILSTCPKSKRYKILDIGTGSGCIAIALAKGLNKSEVHAWDISNEALKVASINARKYGLLLHCKKVDMRSRDKQEKQDCWDLIVSNPPYVRPSEADNSTRYEPDIALFSPEDDPLMYYRHILQFAKTKLRPEGQLFFECSSYTAYDLMLLARSIGFKEIELKEDLSGHPRMIRIQGVS